MNESYYPLTFWQSPVYHWERLIEAVLEGPSEAQP
jgi:hypothetical protein